MAPESRWQLCRPTAFMQVIDQCNKGRYQRNPLCWIFTQLTIKTELTKIKQFFSLTPTKLTMTCRKKQATYLSFAGYFQGGAVNNPTSAPARVAQLGDCFSIALSCTHFHILSVWLTRFVTVTLTFQSFRIWLFHPDYSCVLHGKSRDNSSC